MSQDNQNLQPPASSEPQANQSVSKPPQKPKQGVTPIWKATIIRFLRGTIGVLETTVVKLETTPPLSTEKKPGFLQRLDSSLSRFLRTVRLFLPSSVSNNLSDTTLAGILAVVAVVIVWTTSTVFTGKSVEIATLPPVEEVPVSPPLEEITPREAIPEAIPEPIPEAIPEAIPEPIPIVELTPEESLIAAIESQLGEISRIQSTEDDGTSASLIKSIQANFRSSNLTINISDDWYTLEISQQDKLAMDILQRAKELNFSHLEMIDSQDRLIARNPVVGNKMVIFKRSESMNLQVKS